MSFSRSLRVLFWGSSFTLALLVVGGCSKGAPTVSGTVKYKGQPLNSGTLTFVSEADPSKSRATSIGANGAYKIENPPLGKVKAAVEVKVMAVAPGGAPPKGVDVPGAKVGQTRPILIPPKYADPKTSGLSYTIEAAQPALDIELQ